MKRLKEVLFAKKVREIRAEIWAQTPCLSMKEKDRLYSWVIDAPVRHWELRLHCFLNYETPNVAYEWIVKNAPAKELKPLLELKTRQQECFVINTCGLLVNKNNHSHDSHTTRLQ